MRQPTTEPDTRFSDEAAVATGWEETRRALEEAELFWISTVRADGRPHVTPLVAVWLDDAIYFATGPDEQWVAQQRRQAELRELIDRDRPELLPRLRARVECELDASRPGWRDGYRAHSR